MGLPDLKRKAEVIAENGYYYHDWSWNAVTKDLAVRLKFLLRHARKRLGGQTLEGKMGVS
jgi:hypothetical protein